MTSLFQQHIEYIKDNPENLWFKRKLYGWGWTPVRWQGWAVIGVYIAIIMTLAFVVVDKDSSMNEVLLKFLLPEVILTFILIYVCYKKGEKPRWQWGLPEKNEKI